MQMKYPNRNIYITSVEECVNQDNNMCKLSGYVMFYDISLYKKAFFIRQLCLTDKNAS